MQTVHFYVVLTVSMIACVSVWGADFSAVVVDSQTRLPMAARIYLRNGTTGTDYLVISEGANAAVAYQKQSFVNARSVEVHTSVPARPFKASSLPAGQYTLLVEKGKEYFPQSFTFELVEGESKPEITIALKRWVNMSERGWYSGETHLHRRWDQMPIISLSEDLNVSFPITYWCIDAYEIPKPWDKNPEGPVPDGLIEVDATHVIWPRNTEYEITKVQGKPHTLGALFILNHRDPLSLGAPDWKPIANHARSIGALMDMDKLDWPFAMTLPHSTGATLYELANNHMWRTEFGFTKWNTEAPAFLQPPNGGKEGDENDWLDYTLGLYYTLLNAGFPLVPTAGTASGVHPVPAGFSRVYVQIEGKFSYERWLSGLSAGRSFVTTGPMMFAKVNNHDPGETITNRELKLDAEILSEFPLKSVELVQNGRITPIKNDASTQLENGAWETRLKLATAMDTSGWLCLRCLESRPDGRPRFAHSAPWHVFIPGKPNRLTRQEKEYLVSRVQREIERSRGVLSESALLEYDAALQRFELLQTRDDDE